MKVRLWFRRLAYAYWFRPDDGDWQERSGRVRYWPLFGARVRQPAEEGYYSNLTIR